MDVNAFKQRDTAYVLRHDRNRRLTDIIKPVKILSVKRKIVTTEGPRKGTRWVASHAPEDTFFVEHEGFSLGDQLFPTEESAREHLERARLTDELWRNMTRQRVEILPLNAVRQILEILKGTEKGVKW